MDWLPLLLWHEARHYHPSDAHPGARNFLIRLTELPPFPAKHRRACNPTPPIFWLGVRCAGAPRLTAANPIEVWGAGARRSVGGLATAANAQNRLGKRSLSQGTRDSRSKTGPNRSISGCFAPSRGGTRCFLPVCYSDTLKKLARRCLVRGASRPVVETAYRVSLARPVCFAMAFMERARRASRSARGEKRMVFSRRTISWSESILRPRLRLVVEMPCRLAVSSPCV